MDAKQLLTELEALAEKLAVDVQYDKFTGEGARSGGLCKVRGRWRAIVERRSADTEKVSVLVRCLARFDFAAQIISPELDKLLTRQANASKATETVEGAENDNAEGEPKEPEEPEEQPSPKETDAN